jgi:hypothetical protein
MEMSSRNELNPIRPRLLTKDEIDEFMERTNPMNDRNQQIDWLFEQANTISYYDTSNSTARELVEYWEKNTSTPKWYDNHDREYLIELVEKATR